MKDFFYSGIIYKATGSALQETEFLNSNDLVRVDFDAPESNLFKEIVITDKVYFQISEPTLIAKIEDNAPSIFAVLLLCAALF